jgi:hypothetical protein
MSRTRSAGAPEGTVSGICRSPRRRGEAPRGKEWVRPYKRAQRALDDAASTIISTVRRVVDAGCCASRPVQSTRILIAALRQVTVASQQYAEAKRCLDEAAEALGHTPPELQDGEAPWLLGLAADRSRTVRRYIDVAVQEVLLGHAEILNGVAAGELVPEDPSEDGPRRRVIVITPRPLFVRAFLAARRQPRAGDRIAPVLRRRRRTPLPAEVRVPRRNLRGRAPPFSACSL